MAVPAPTSVYRRLFAPVTTSAGKRSPTPRRAGRPCSPAPARASHLPPRAIRALPQAVGGELCHVQCGLQKPPGVVEVVTEVGVGRGLEGVGGHLVPQVDGAARTTVEYRAQRRPGLLRKRTQQVVHVVCREIGPFVPVKQRPDARLDDCTGVPAEPAESGSGRLEVAPTPRARPSPDLQQHPVGVHEPAEGVHCLAGGQADLLAPPHVAWFALVEHDGVTGDVMLERRPQAFRPDRPLGAVRDEQIDRTARDGADDLLELQAKLPPLGIVEIVEDDEEVDVAALVGGAAGHGAEHQHDARPDVRERLGDPPRLFEARRRRHVGCRSHRTEPTSAAASAGALVGRRASPPATGCRRSPIAAETLGLSALGCGA